MKQEKVLSLAVIWICSVFTPLTVWADQPGTFIRFGKRSGHRVVNSFQTYSFVSHIQCMYNCYKLQETVCKSCKSVNYNTALNTCELSTDVVTSSSVLSTEEGWNVFYLSEFCEDGWIKSGGKCYKINVNALSWNQAETYCESVGSTLVIVDDAAEHKFVKDTINGGWWFYWIGARYYSAHGGYRWVDGTEITFDRWYPGEPDLINGCVDYLKSFGYLWNAHGNCVSTYGPSICEKCVSY